MKNFFISYTKTDLGFATWIAELLEKNNYSVAIQAWDFQAGDNFVSNINNALVECEKLIIILSKQYLKSKWCEAEWTSKMIEQIRTKERQIIPIRIEPIDLEGLLASIIYIDIVDKNKEEAELEILNGIKEGKIRKSEGYPSYYNVEHEYVDNQYFVQQDSIIYIKSCKSKALIGGRDRIHSRITWFADETIQLSPLTEGIYIEHIDLRDTNMNYNIVFDHKLEKNEEVEYKIKAVLSNKNHHFDNFFSTQVITTIKRLNVHLYLWDKSVKKIYTQKLSSSPMNVRTEPQVENEFMFPFHWEIINPEINFEYKIWW